MNKIVAAAAFCLAAGVATPALAHPAQPQVSKGSIRATVTPNKHVTSGTKLHLTAHKALKSAPYECVQVIVKGTSNAANLSSIVQTKSNKKGVVKCTETFHPFSGLIGSTSVKCPTSKKLAKQGYSCAVAVFDQASQGQTSATVALFKAKN